MAEKVLLKENLKFLPSLNLLPEVAFGYWLSGFVDGEGCFQSQLNLFGGKRNRPAIQPRFSISLRIDDGRVLDEIKSFLERTYELNCNINTTYGQGKYAPMARLRVSGWKNCYRLLPQFERFPLKAKKAFDYEIWKELILLAHGQKERSRRENRRFEDMLKLHFCLGAVKLYGNKKEVGQDG